jgi:hypothetical protein
VPTFINLPSGKGRMVPHRSKLGHWYRVIQAFDPTINRLTLRLFSQFQFIADISTVEIDRFQRPVAPQDRYSKVSQIKSVVGRLKLT